MTLVEEFRVGSLEGGRPESFAALKGLVALPGGGFAVLDSHSQAQEIRVFGADESHVSTHGRPPVVVGDTFLAVVTDELDVP